MIAEVALGVLRWSLLRVSIAVDRRDTRGGSALAAFKKLLELSLIVRWKGLVLFQQGDKCWATLGASAWVG